MLQKSRVEKYQAFTLLEMLLVLAILSILGSVSISAFSGLQSSVSVNQETENISQDVRNLQRSSILLTRDENERWLYGLGIDFSKYTDTGTYTLFKWCSPYDDYGATQTESDIPGYDGNSLSSTDLPTADYSTDCSKGIGLSRLVKYGETYITDMDLHPRIVSRGYYDQPIAYVLFESISGRAFFYDKSGKLINYDSTTGNLVSSPVNFVIQLSTNETIKTITVKNLSGKISIESEANE